ncbi:MAG: FAD binding domain-containing protein [Chloroflexota bacterium]
MARVQTYHRPQTLAEALTLLARSGWTGAPLAGGTALVPRLVRADNTVQAVIDLSDLGLDAITCQDGWLRLGATATLADVTENEVCVSVAGGLLDRAARMSATVNVRNAATVGGTVAAGDPASAFLLALLLLDAEVLIQTLGGEFTMPLGGFLHAPAQALNGSLLTEVRLALPNDQVGAGLARLGRTPQDRPIVMAAALLAREGSVAARLRLALGGVAGVPVRATTVEEALTGRPFTAEALAGALTGWAALLKPPGDFRGSAEYRRVMAPILARRALQEAWVRARS